MTYRNESLELKVLGRQFRNEVRNHKGVMILGFLLGLMIGVRIML